MDAARPADDPILRWGPVAAILAFLCLYAACSAPGVTWEDSASYHLRLEEGRADGAFHPYPLYYGLLKAAAAIPVGEIPWRLNALHSILSVACLGILFLLVRKVSGSPRAGLYAVLCLGFSHLFWHYAQVMKVYPLMNLLLLTTFLGLAWASRENLGPLWLSGAAYGLSLGTHPFVGAAAPGIAAWLLWGWRTGLTAAAGRWSGGFLLGAAGILPFYWEALDSMGPAEFLRNWAFAGHGETRTGLSQGSELLTIAWGRLPEDLAEWGAFLLYQFPGTLWLAPLGIRECMRRNGAAGRALLVLYACYALIPLDFNVPLKINFYLPSFLLAAIWCGVGFHARFPGGDRPSFLRAAGFLVMLSPLLYATVVFGFLERARPERFYPSWDASYKDRARFYLWPPKPGFDEPRRYAESVRSTAEPDATAVVDFQEADVLRYFQARKLLSPALRIHHIPPWKDARIFCAEVLGLWAGGPLYLGKIYRPLWRDAGWDWREAGPFDQVTFPFSWEASHEETTRVPSPAGEADAVVVWIQGGAAVSSAHAVYLVPPGGDWRKRDPAASFYAAIRSNGAPGVRLRWAGPRVLTIGYLSVRSVTVHALHPRVGNKEFSIASLLEKVGD